MKIWNHDLWDPLYGEMIYIFVGPVEGFREHMTRTYPDQDDPDHESDPYSNGKHLIAKNMVTGRPEYYLWIAEWKNDRAGETERLGWLAHESFHLTSTILQSRGLTLCAESEEAFAYYHSALVRGIWTLLNGNRTKIREAARRYRARSRGRAGNHSSQVHQLSRSDLAREGLGDARRRGSRAVLRVLHSRVHGPARV